MEFFEWLMIFTMLSINIVIAANMIVKAIEKNAPIINIYKNKNENKNI